MDRCRFSSMNNVAATYKTKNSTPMNGNNCTGRSIFWIALGCWMSVATASAADADNQDSQKRIAQTVAPGGIEEVCLPLSARQKLNYTFTASGNLVFSIHYHEGDRIFFPIPDRVTSEENNSFTADVNQDYCLMWENRGAASVELNLKYEKLDRAHRRD